MAIVNCVVLFHMLHHIPTPSCLFAKASRTCSVCFSSIASYRAKDVVSVTPGALKCVDVCMCVCLNMSSRQGPSQELYNPQLGHWGQMPPLESNEEFLTGRTATSIMS